MNYTNNPPFFFNKTTTKSTTCANASPPNARTSPAKKKHSPPIIESWEWPYLIRPVNNIAPCRLFQCFRRRHVPTFWRKFGWRFYVCGVVDGVKWNSARRRLPLALCWFRENSIERLLADTEFLLSDDSTVAVDVLANQVVEQTTTLTYEHLQWALCVIIFFVGLQMFGQVGDTNWE